MKTLAIVLALTVSITLPAARADEAREACNDFRRAIAVWRSATSMFDTLRVLYVEGDEKRLAMIQWAGSSVSEAQKVADEAEQRVFTLDPLNRTWILQGATLSRALTARGAYQELVERLKECGGPLLHETFEADRSLTDSYYTLVFAARC